MRGAVDSAFSEVFEQELMPFRETCFSQTYYIGINISIWIKYTFKMENLSIKYTSPSYFSLVTTPQSHFLLAISTPEYCGNNPILFVQAVTEVWNLTSETPAFKEALF